MVIVIAAELPEVAVSSTWTLSVGAFDAGAVAKTGSMTNKIKTRMSLFMGALGYNSRISGRNCQWRLNDEPLMLLPLVSEQLRYGVRMSVTKNSNTEACSSSLSVSA